MRRHPESVSSNTRIMADTLFDARDDFDNLVTRGTVNTEDLPSDKPFSCERYRLFTGADGSNQSNRVLLQYGEGSGIFNDAEDNYELLPGEGQTLTFKTARRFRYIVGFVNEWSRAAGLSRPLESGEYLEIMMDFDGSGSDGHGIMIRPDEQYIFERRNGTPGQARSAEDEAVDVDIRNNGTTFARYVSEYSWYNVGPATFTQSFPENNDLTNRSLGSVAPEPGQGSRYSLGHVTMRIHRETGTPSITATAGSTGYSVKGDVTPTGRTKGAVVDSLTHSGSGEWEPLAAFRFRDGYETVPCDVARLLPLGGPEGELGIISVSPTLTDAGETNGWINRGSATAIEFTKDISTFPDGSGTVVTSAPRVEDGGNGYGGFQVALGNTQVTGAGANTNISGTDQISFSPLYPDDIAVVIAYSATSGDFRGRLDISQEW